MALRDSIDKIVESYFAVVTDEDFEYKGKLYRRKPLTVSRDIFRGFSCPSHCGGCCPRFSLDYLPSDDRPYGMPTRVILFNNKSIQIYSDMQEDHQNYHCRNLNMEYGRWSVWSSW